MIQAVLFDGYGTLFDCSLAALLDVSSTIARVYGLPTTAGEFLEAWDRHFFPLLQREPFMSLREANQTSLEVTLREYGIEGDVHAFGHCFSDLLNAAPAFPEVSSVLSSLDGLAHGILSNADNENIEGALRVNNLEMDFVVTSEGVRSYKPQPRIFMHALERLGYDAGDVVYVGDSPDDDIAGATAVGMQTVWLNRRGERYKDGLPEPDYEITDLQGVLGILRSPETKGRIRR